MQQLFKLCLASKVKKSGAGKRKETENRISILPVLWLSAADHITRMMKLYLAFCKGLKYCYFSNIEIRYSYYNTVCVACLEVGPLKMMRNSRNESPNPISL